MRWRFDPEENREGGDRLRVERDGQRILLNDGENRTEKGFTVVHHESWDRHVGFRDFTVPRAGEYVIRVRAAGRVPGRKAVVASAAKILAKRRDEETAKDPAGRKRHEEQYERDLAHFRENRSYGYGPPRMKLVQHLGGTPLVVSEMDVDAPEGEPREYEVRAWFTPVNAGVELEYAYAIPKLLENFWMQGRDEFARPELLIDWIEIEGPVVGSWPPETAGRVLGGAPREGKDEGEEAKEVLVQLLKTGTSGKTAAGEETLFRPGAKTVAGLKSLATAKRWAVPACLPPPASFWTIWAWPPWTNCPCSPRVTRPCRPWPACWKSPRHRPAFRSKRPWPNLPN
jgi:hypothetical protein